MSKGFDGDLDLDGNLTISYSDGEGSIEVREDYHYKREGDSTIVLRTSSSPFYGEVRMTREEFKDFVKLWYWRIVDGLEITPEDLRR